MRQKYSTALQFYWDGEIQFYSSTGMEKYNVQFDWDGEEQFHSSTGMDKYSFAVLSKSKCSLNVFFVCLVFSLAYLVLCMFS